MSFVLDALKVSEQRRSRFKRRIYAHPPRPGRSRRGPGWLMALGVLAGIALVVLGWRLVAVAPEAHSPPAPMTGGADARSASATPAAGTLGMPSAQTAAAQDQEILDKPAPAAAGAGTTPERDSPEQGTQPASPAQGSLRQEQEPMPEPAPEQEPGRNILAAPPPDWPALSLQMLFFSAEENRSFVQVNGGTYRQGEQLAAGPQILRITKDGVILEYRGQQVLMGVER